MPNQNEAKKTEKELLQECFVIMPISDPDSYPSGHFKHVYEDIITPACLNADFRAILASSVQQTNLIHVDILQKILNSPMAICDLSSRNPNVMFELALRQAFDKPVVLIQEIGTPPIFDISLLRYTEYHRERIYHEVLEDQRKISAAIKETFEASRSKNNNNSIIRLLALSKAAEIPELNNTEEAESFQGIVLSELSQMRNELSYLKASFQEQNMESLINFNTKYHMRTNNFPREELEFFETKLFEINKMIFNNANKKECQNFIVELDEIQNRLLILSKNLPPDLSLRAKKLFNKANEIKEIAKIT